MSIVRFAQKYARKRWLTGLAYCTFVLLIGLGVVAGNGWMPRTEAFSGKKDGWFGREQPRNAGGIWNSLFAPPTSPTPQLSKEYIYAGSRLLAVEDANAAQVSLVSVSGTVTKPNGQALANATVVKMDPQGYIRTTTTNSLGIYQFDDVPTSVTYSIVPLSKAYRFTSQQVHVTGTLTNVNFVGLE